MSGGVGSDAVVALVETLSGTDMSALRGEYREALETLIEAKAAGIRPKPAEAPDELEGSDRASAEARSDADFGCCHPTSPALLRPLYDDCLPPTRPALLA
ncbi:hypothetical protein ACGFX2_34840 [Streptomyces goshikiensis]|uniref:hypothetical protein n=1 Tax=Streptomyces goshikiensis TaxID=1942 RepID=UPI0037144C7B